ncbi:TlpA family protein disulfide reductase [Chloroflexota bacterium]
MKKKMTLIMLSVVFILSACSPTAATPEAMAEPSETMVANNDTASDDSNESMAEITTESSSDSSMEGMEGPTWLSALLTNVQTGEQFSISEFKGKVILVENLAMWCSNCKKQQEQVKALHDQLGTDSDLISIGLDIDPNEVADDLKRYTSNNGFDWIYSIAPVEVINEIGNLYGAQFLNPPSTPIIVIDRKGEVHLTPFGIKSVDDLMKFIEPFLSESM